MNEYPDAQVYVSPEYLHRIRLGEEKRALRRQSNRAGLCVLAFLILQYVLALIIVGVRPLFALYVQSDTARGMIEMFNYLVCMFVPFLAGYLTMRPQERDTLTLFGKPTSKPAAATAILAGFLVCTAANYVTTLLLSLLENAGVTVDGGTYDSPANLVQLFYAVLTIGLLPAFIEEFALRGIVMQPMRRFGDRFAILMSAFVFALMHGNLTQFAFALAVGIAIGYFVIATGSIWVGIAIHMLNNLYSVFLNYLLETRPTAAEKFANLELSVTLVGGVVCFALFMTVCRRNRLKKPDCTLTGAQKTAAYLLTVPMVISVIWLVVKTVRLISFGGQ